VSVDLKDLAVNSKARPHLERANKAIGKRDFTSALTLLENAVSLQPDLPSAFSTMGQVLMKLKRADEAEAAFARALVLIPDYFEALKGIGYLYLTTGREGQAIEPLSRAAALHRNDGSIHGFLGEALYHAKRVSEAEAPLRRALALYPGNFRASYRLGYVYLELNRYPEALECFRLFLKTNVGLNETKVRALVDQLERRFLSR
jgi:tetratricopeptide (TPR) repeat protein